jgi:aspartyl-tRNA(Asn)/glutamyl-tRNA(Gln) amidotransferase subunit A
MRGRAGGDIELGALAGVPVAIKDLLCTTDMPTTCGSRFCEKYVSPYDGTVIAKMRAAGMPWMGENEPRRICDGWFD